MKKCGAYFLFLLVLWFILIPGNESVNIAAPAATTPQISKADSLIYLQNEEFFLNLEESGYYELYLMTDSPWPLPDTTRHP